MDLDKIVTSAIAAGEMRKQEKELVASLDNVRLAKTTIETTIEKQIQDIIDAGTFGVSLDLETKLRSRYQAAEDDDIRVCVERSWACDWWHVVVYRQIALNQRDRIVEARGDTPEAAAALLLSERKTRRKVQS